MSERVLMNSQLFKVSAPGFDASTAAFKNLLIDSTSPNRAVSGFQIGSATWQPYTYDYMTGIQTGGMVTINFPNLGYPPLVFWQMNYDGKSISQGYWSALYGVSGEQGEAHGGSVDVFNDRIRFYAATPYGGTLHYMICHAQI